MRAIGILTAISLLAACSDLPPGLSDMSSLQDSAVLVPAPGQPGELFPNKEDMTIAAKAFAARDYGAAMMAYRKAIDLAPADPEAWLGYAASADMLGQFDVSDHAYKQLEKAIGDRVEFLNNYGYSQMLRGNLVRARTIFETALEKDPNNKVTLNNLAMLTYIVEQQAS